VFAKKLTVSAVKNEEPSPALVLTEGVCWWCLKLQYRSVPVLRGGIVVIVMTAWIHAAVIGKEESQSLPNTQDAKCGVKVWAWI